MPHRLLPSFNLPSITREQIRIDKFCVEFKRHKIQSYLEHSSKGDDGFSSFLSMLTCQNQLFGIHTPNNNTTGQAMRFNSGYLISGSPFYFNKSANPFPVRHPLHSRTQIRKFTLLLNCNFTRFYQVQSEQAIPLANELGDGIWWHHTGIGEANPRVRLPSIYNQQRLESLDLLLDSEENRPRNRQTGSFGTTDRVLGISRKPSTTPRTLDGNDNMLSEGLWRRTENILPLFSFYLGLCMDAIERSFALGHSQPDYETIGRFNNNRVSGGYIEDENFLRDFSVVPLFDWNGGMLTELQLYTEFAVDNSLEWMRIYSPSICEASRDYERTDYPVLIRGRKLESPSLTIWLTDKIILKIYAKDMRRVRFEITYKNVRSVINTQTKKFRVQGVSGLKLQTGESSIVDMVSIAMDDAVRRIKNFVENIPQQQSPTYDIQALNKLMWEINSVASDYNTAERVLSCLLTNRSIAQYDDNKKIIQRLQRKGFISKIQSTERPRPPRYRLTPEYYAALEAFAEHYPDND